MPKTGERKKAKASGVKPLARKRVTRKRRPAVAVREVPKLVEPAEPLKPAAAPKPAPPAMPRKPAPPAKPTNPPKSGMLAAPILTGLALGIISNLGVLEGAWWNLILWGAAGAVLGWVAWDKKESVRIGAIYGASVTLSFLFFGFKGAPEKLPGFILLSVVISLLGAICGAFSARFGLGFKNFFKL